MATKEEILSTFKSEEGAQFAYKEGVQTGYYEAYNSLRNQAAIAAMQGVMNIFGSLAMTEILLQAWLLSRLMLLLNN